MKQIRFVILFLGLLLAIPSHAQKYGFWDNTFYSLGGGVSMYNNEHYDPFSNMGFYGELSVGKWISNCMAARITLPRMVMAQNKYEFLPEGADPDDPNAYQTRSKESNSLMADFSIMFDPVNAVRIMDNPNQRVRIFPIIGLGIVYRMPNDYSSRDLDFQGYVGFHNEYQFGAPRRLNVLFFIEAKMMLFPGSFDGNESLSNMLHAGGGFKFNFNRSSQAFNPPSHLSNRSRFWHEDWYWGAAVGINSLHYAGCTLEGRLASLSPMAQLTLGKYLSPIFSMRLQAEGGLQGLEAYQGRFVDRFHFPYQYTHADMMMNLSNLASLLMRTSTKAELRSRTCSRTSGLTNARRICNAELFAGAGFLTRLDNLSSIMSADAGARLRFTVNPTNDVYVEYRYTLAVPRLLSGYAQLESNKILSVFYHSLMFGFNHNIGVHDYSNKKH